MNQQEEYYAFFVGTVLNTHGPLQAVVRAAKRATDMDAQERLVIYQDSTGRVIDIDYRGTVEDVLERLKEHPLVGEDLPPTPQQGPGRPKLGVVSREVTLLPRQWEWLSKQRGGASATLRRLVDDARKHRSGKELARDIEVALDRFLWDMASNFEGFEEATRALYKGNDEDFERHTQTWPNDVRKYTLNLYERLSIARKNMEM